MLEEKEEEGAHRIHRDFLAAKKASIKMANALLKKYDWIKDFRWKGDISFKSNRTKKSVREAAESGEEVSFGLDMVMTYVDKKGVKKETDILMRFKPAPFYDVYFKAMKDKPTVEDLVEQMKDVWIYLAQGNTPEKPKAIIVTKLGLYPKECFKNAEGNKGHKGRFKIAFHKWIPWRATNAPILIGETIDQEFEKMRI